MNIVLNAVTQFFGNIPVIWAVMLEKIAPSLQIMWKGMLGIFVVMAVIAIIVFLFTKIFKNK